MGVKIYIIEDHPLVQRTLSEFLDRLPDVTVSGIATTAKEALDQLPSVSADLALVDVSLPDMSGIEVVGQLQTMLPDLRCLMLSGHQETVYVQRALLAGARGYVAKGNPLELAHAIQQVIAGEIYLSEAVRAKLKTVNR